MAIRIVRPDAMPGMQQYKITVEFLDDSVEDFIMLAFSESNAIQVILLNSIDVNGVKDIKAEKYK